MKYPYVVLDKFVSAVWGMGEEVGTHRLLVWSHSVSSSTLFIDKERLLSYLCEVALAK